MRKIKSNILLFTILEDILYFKIVEESRKLQELEEEWHKSLASSERNLSGFIRKGQINFYVSSKYQPIEDLPREEIIVELCCLARDNFGKGLYAFGSGLKEDRENPLYVLTEVEIIS